MQLGRAQRLSERGAGGGQASLTLDLTHRCPFRCAGCIEQVGMAQSGYAALHAETACRLITQFADGGGTEVLLYGGEPTAHPRFDAVVRHAARSVARVFVVTNGASLDRPRVFEAVRQAAEQATIGVRVSLNAARSDTHDALHRTGGFFPRVVRGMKSLAAGSRVQLSVSFLAEELNAAEVGEAFEIARQVGAADFWIRPKTAMHGVGLVPLSERARQAVVEDVDRLQTCARPRLHVERWYVDTLRTGRLPSTDKPYSACYYCAAARLVICPPEPGVVWACTYWRGHPRFHVADLNEVAFGSPEFERLRRAAVRRVVPSRDCASVLCNRDGANRAIWDRLGGVLKKTA